MANPDQIAMDIFIDDRKAEQVLAKVEKNALATITNVEKKGKEASVSIARLLADSLTSQRVQVEHELNQAVIRTHNISRTAGTGGLSLASKEAAVLRNRLNEIAVAMSKT